MARTTFKPERRLVPLEQASVYACCSTKTLRRRISDGSLTGYRMGPRLLRVDLNELDEQLLRPVPTTGRGAA